MTGSSHHSSEDESLKEEYEAVVDTLAATQAHDVEKEKPAAWEHVVLDKELAIEDGVDKEYGEGKGARVGLSRATSHAPTEQSVASWSTRDLENVDSKQVVQPNYTTAQKFKRWLMLKKTHIPPIPEERGVSREYNASILSQITFQWMAPLMSVGYQRTIELNDIWEVNPRRRVNLLGDKLATSFKKRVARGDKRPLLGAMHETFKFEFWLGGACQLTASVISVVNPFVLRYLITFAGEAYASKYYHTPAPSIGRGVGLAIAVSCLQLIQAASTAQFMYRGMMNGGQARGALIAVIFDKAMTISGRARAGGKALEEIDASTTNGIKPGSKEERSFFRKLLGRSGKKTPPGPVDHKGIVGTGEGWSNGRIINLMSVDTQRIDQAGAFFHMIWTSPIAVIITLILLLVNITYSALAGFAFIIILLPLLSKAIKSLFSRRKGINKITDERVSLTQEILHSVRFVKFFGWETSFIQRLGKLRDREVRAVQWVLAIRNLINAVGTSIPVFASMLAFITYALSNHGLNPAYIFSSLALFNGLRLPLTILPLIIGQVTDAAASVGRIQEFLLAEDAQDPVEKDTESKDALVVENGSFTWERARTGNEEKKDAAGKTKPQATGNNKSKRDKFKEALRLRKPQNVEETKVTVRQLDSSSTLAEEPPFAMQGLNFSIGRDELVAVIGAVGSGKSSLLAALAGDMRRTGGVYKMGADRAFCPQSAWIQNATVRENVLFGKQYNSRWYNRVIDACALRPDLDILPNGDSTEIGERGITVSGGQKQRLNIARAIYFDSEIVLMDDPLSAVDAHVGRHIFDQAILGLLAGKCRVLATHQLWVLKRCDRIIWMDEGRIMETGTYDSLMANNPEFVKLIASNAQEEKTEEEEHANDDEREDEKKTQRKKRGKKPNALMQVEERAVSSVSWGVYAAYIRAAHGLYVLPLILFLLIAAMGSTILTSLWLSWWTSNKFGYSTGAYIGGYAALGVAQAVLMFFFSIGLSVYGTNASKVMLQRAVTKVLRAPMSFFDTTPLGRITNRFSRDVDTMDNQLTDNMRFFLTTFGMIVGVFILIIAYFYYFAVALAPLACAFVFAAGYYRASAREIKRHEAVLRSHVFARFSEAVTGISTIRAYGLERQFADSVRSAVDNMNSAYFITFSNQRWLSFRLDIVGVLLVFVTAILVVTSRFSVDPSIGGLVLSYILSIVQMLSFSVRQLAEVENNMNSTERIHYYGTQLEEEAALHAAEVPESWPQKGEIAFEDVEMRYRDGLPLVLKGLNLHIKGGERIGVVGRTGAGKSSIMGTLFRLVELSSGKISIDGVDISTVGLHDLRSRMAIIPQDPTLFRGTIRSNLDPFNKFTDAELWLALQQADLVSADSETSEKSGRVHLDSVVEEEGLNFSLGQRQLMALARALVRDSRIIICDEATSSVDMDTDQRIQDAMRKGFQGKTLLCIAHRLRTIIHYDRIVVMDQGQIAECDTPLALLEQGGIFAQMCTKSSITRDDIINDN